MCSWGNRSRGVRGAGEDGVVSLRSTVWLVTNAVERDGVCMFCRPRSSRSFETFLSVLYIIIDDEVQLSPLFTDSSMRGRFTYGWRRWRS